MKNTDGFSSYVLMTLAALFFAGAFFAGKIGMQEFPPVTLTFLRFLTATILLLPFVLRVPLEERTLRPKDLPLLAALGVVGIFGYHVLFFSSLDYISPVASAILGSLTPLVSSVMAAFLVGERLGARRLGGILLAFAGVLVAVTNGDFAVIREMRFGVGDLLMLSAVFCQATYAVLSRKAIAGYPPLVVLFFAFVGGLAAMLPFAAAEKPWLLLPQVTWRGWTSVLYMAVFASMLGYLFQQMAIRDIGVGRTMPFYNLVPIFAILLGALLFSDPVVPTKLAGAAAILAGVSLGCRPTSVAAVLRREPKSSSA